MKGKQRISSDRIRLLFENPGLHSQHEARIEHVDGRTSKRRLLLDGQQTCLGGANMYIPVNLDNSGNQSGRTDVVEHAASRTLRRHLQQTDVNVMDSTTNTGISNEASSSHVQLFQTHEPQNTLFPVLGGSPPNPSIISAINDIPLTPFHLPHAPLCLHCGAKRFYREPKGFCCSDGEVSLVVHEPPTKLWTLFTSNSPEAVSFRACIRIYNNTFAFTSFGVKYDKDLCRRNKGIYTFRAQGQVYHYINGLVPLEGHPSCLQLYFYDTEHEIGNRMHLSQRLQPEILVVLMDILSHNPFARFFRSLANMPSFDECRIIIRDNAGLDQRVFNAPACSEIAAIWVESSCDTPRERDIVVYSHPGFTHCVKYYFGCYDPLQYPLLFPLGESGWHEGINRQIRGHIHQSRHESNTNIHAFDNAEQFLASEMSAMKKGQKKCSSISCREYYCYKLQIRSDNHAIILHSGRLFQQYIVDMYIKLETSRLDYFRLNQQTIRSDLYSGIMDSIAFGDIQGGNVGHKLVLPATFIGGPLDMRRRYVDAMSLVQRFGKPDIFLTMTCNPSWPEITSELLPIEEAQNRPDLVTRIFRSKLEELKHDLFKRHVLGYVAGYVYVVEFQKRGLPHVHFLLIMKPCSRINSPDIFDRFVSAEIPKEASNANLRRAVSKHMMHGPCGSLNPSNVCMKKSGKCRNHFPKDFCPKTNQTNDSYPVYMRRDNKESLKVRNHYLDNRWVVPYNSYLLAKFDCHLNVEICSTIKADKYLYKYIYKGHDQVSFRVQLQQNDNSLDEIALYQSGRWVSPPEAAWRIYRFLLNEISPAVVALHVHLENEQSVTFSQNSNLKNVVQNPCAKKTMLTEYFYMNKTNPEARQLYYSQFPERFVWNQRHKIWTVRKRGFAIGRMVTVSPGEGERYFLRVLLNTVRGATCYADLRFFNGKQYKTFRDAALARGLLEADNSLQLCLSEASTYQMPSSMRRLFATILVYCNPVTAGSLWMEFEDHMLEDFFTLPRMTRSLTQLKAIGDIGHQLQSMGKNIKDYNLPIQNFDIDNQMNVDKEIEDELKIVTPQQDLQSIQMLNGSQKLAYDTVLDHAINERAAAFFVDGPGGTGKTFLYRALLARLRSNGYIALATASSGVAASILPGGRTAHSRFKIPLNADETVGCSVNKQSGLARLLRVAKLIVWDEAPMVKRQAIEALDRMLQDVCNSTSLFGGKVIVFGGDFRQILPVVPKTTIEHTIEASLLKSPLWPKFIKLKLTDNMRAQSDPQFSDFLLRIGDDREPKVNEDEIKLPASMIIKQEENDCLMRLLNETFPNINKARDTLWTVENRAILAPRNDIVDEINALLIDKFEGDEVFYHSFDSAIDTSQHGFHEDFCNTLTPSGFPPHLLHLKLNCPILLLRNLDPSRGMCNGTRLICKGFGKNVIHAEIASGNYKGNQILLPHIPLLPVETENGPFNFKRTQFPVQLCFAMTINKAQGQTLDFIGVYLPCPVFSHGQLYVALSRARESACVRILVVSPLVQPTEYVWTRNVVYAEVLALANK